MTSTPPDAARRYARIRYRLMLLELVGWLAFLWAYHAAGLSAITARWASTLSHVETVRLAVYLSVFGACSYLIFFPLHVYGGFVLEHQFGLSRLRFTGWLRREAKQALLSGGLGLLLAEGLYALLRGAPSWWPFLAALGWIGVSVLLARVFPTWLLPLFYKTVPLHDESLAARLLALCQRAQLSVLGIFQVDLGVETRKANAALAGFGRTRRVLVSDTLLERFSPEEIETVLAHELGHQRHRHITKLLILSGLGSWLALMLVDHLSLLWISPLGVRGLADIAGFPLLMLALSLIGLIGLPIQQALSRHFEWQADRFAVTLSRRPADFAAALRKLGELNLADPAPPRWVEWLFYDHPPLPKRIQAAEAASS
ncbi:MAG: M48 family metallopeptidase [Candidatus Omnitrophica bacterium]|nr:M48 family metallopeptidase [Candidatus Omnitrophota bacterium]